MDGGENQFADGFKVAQDLKEANKEAFDILSATKVCYSDVGVDMYGGFHKLTLVPTIELDAEGHFACINYNNQVTIITHLMTK